MEPGKRPQGSTVSICRAHFFRAAISLLKLGRRDEAAAVLQAGVAVAAARGETHAVSKMQELLETLG